MSLIVYAEASNGNIVQYLDRLRADTLQVTIHAEEASVGESSIVLDDIDGTFDVRGHKQVYFVETDAALDDWFGIIGPFYTWNRRIHRAEYSRTSNGRVWEISLKDINTLLSRRVQKGTDAQRHAETDVDRILWLANTAEVIGGVGDFGLSIDDQDFIFTDSSVQMDATDYTGNDSAGVINDLLQDSSKNAYLFNSPSASSNIRIGMWYGVTGRDEFASPHRISNILSDINIDPVEAAASNTPAQLLAGTWTFPPSFDAELDRDPSRVYSGIMVQYDGSYVYDTEPATRIEFAARDGVMAAELVKTQAQAERRAAAYLLRLNQEDDAIECSVLVPSALIHAFVPGHRVQVRFAHLPDYNLDWTWMRVARVTYSQVSNAAKLYELALDLRQEYPPNSSSEEGGGGASCAGGAYPLTPSATYPRLHSQTTDANGYIFYVRPGLAIPQGPTPGYHGTWFFPVFDGTADFNCDSTSREIILVVGPGTLTIHTTNEKRGGATLASSFNAELWKKVNGSGTPDTLLSTPTGTPGVDLEVDIPDDDATDCVHYLQVYGVGGSMGVNGFTWEQA